MTLDEFEKIFMTKAKTREQINELIRVRGGMLPKLINLARDTKALADSKHWNVYESEWEAVDKALHEVFSDDA